MGDKEVETNGKTFGESTRVTLSVKTLMWIVGLLLSAIVTLATTGYLDIKSDVKTIEGDSKKEKLEYKEEMKEVIQNELRYEREKREKMVEDIGEIKGDIKVILEKTRGLEGGNGSHQPHSMPTITPDSTFSPSLRIH